MGQICFEARVKFTRILEMSFEVSHLVGQVYLCFGNLA